MLQVVTLDEQFLRYVPAARPPSKQTLGPRSSILLRCSVEEAKRIRLAAAKKRMKISSFVLEQLRRAWRIREMQS
jgi:hypothetical protein